MWLTTMHSNSKAVIPVPIDPVHHGFHQSLLFTTVKTTNGSGEVVQRYNNGFCHHFVVSTAADTCFQMEDVVRILPLSLTLTLKLRLNLILSILIETPKILH
ncbi:MAG: hypothetical protein AVO35_10340 [Candidatus Aegiribacteria sp. MLS_C]|nr:MAG: hypothetical protein AVO35_10340 [Candidatus Aegiribacteria sp. MLS_C]